MQCEVGIELACALHRQPATQARELRIADGSDGVQAIQAAAQQHDKQARVPCIRRVRQPWPQAECGNGTTGGKEMASGEFHDQVLHWKAGLANSNASPSRGDSARLTASAVSASS